MYLTANSGETLSFSCTDKHVFIRAGIAGPMMMLSLDEAEETIIGMMPYLSDEALARIAVFGFALDMERHPSGRVPGDLTVTGYGDEQTHSDYPHYPGYLHGCPACEARCFCAPGSAECVYGGEHSTFDGEA